LEAMEDRRDVALTDSETNSTPTVPLRFRRRLEKMLWSDLDRSDATTATIALSQFLRELEPLQPVSLPKDPIVTADNDGDLTIISADALPEDNEVRIGIDPQIARELKDISQSLDPEELEDFVWEMDLLLRGEVELVLLYEEMMLGHLILNHRENAQALLELSEDEWFEKHRSHHA